MYVPAIADWINSFTHDDDDHDQTCNATDNCSIPNPDQANCNKTAEDEPTWGGAQLGDACDPTPCPMPSVTQTDFVTATSGIPKAGDGVLIFTNHGRSIRDQLDVVPILDDGSAAISSARPRFCLCRDATGAPLPDLEACLGPPFHCTLDPKQTSYTEAGGGAPLPNQTYWHKITLDTGFGATVPLSYPGAEVSRTWDYATDYQAWLAAGWVSALAVDPKFAPGTDLGGWMWMHDGTSKGFAAHGGVANPADAFAPVAPDPRATSKHHKRIPRYKPNPWWSYCAPCGDEWRFSGEQVSNPAPFVTLDPESLHAHVWTADGGADATAALSLALRRALAGPSLFVGASEPAPVTRSHALARQLQLSSDGSTVLGAVTRGRSGFDLQPIGARGPTPRTGFAAAWSRTAGALFVVGGTSATGAPLGQAWTWRPDAGFTVAALDPALAPMNAEASVFSPHDARMWIVDRTRTGRRLIRLDPASGIVESTGQLPLGADLETAYLTTDAAGRVLLVGAIGARHRIVRLAAPRFTAGGRVTAAAHVEGTGAPLGAPVVAGDQVHLAIGVTTDEAAIIESHAVAIP